MNHIETIHGFIVENFLFGDGEQLTNETSFLDSGIIDSTGILELITFLEETYNITIEDDELIPENLDSLNNVVKFIGQKNSCAE
jgi:acyl carrier protein